MNNQKPNSLQFLYKLKTISLCQYSKHIVNGSYSMGNDPCTEDDANVFDYLESEEFKQSLDEYHNREDLEENDVVEDYIHSNSELWHSTR